MRGQRSRNFWHAIRKDIFERDSGMCVYCGALATEIDHVIPFIDGGKQIRSNCVCACRRCNQYRAKHPSDEVTLTRAIFWLMQCGEDISWMDDYYKISK